MNRYIMIIICGLLTFLLGIFIYGNILRIEHIDREKTKISDDVSFALSSAACTLKENIGNPNVKDYVVEEFFCALSFALGEETSTIKRFVPCFVFACEDGFYVSSLDKDSLEYIWTPLLQYQVEIMEKTDTDPEIELFFHLYDIFGTSSSYTNLNAVTSYSDFFGGAYYSLPSEKKQAVDIIDRAFDRASYSQLTSQTFETIRIAAIRDSIETEVTKAVDNHNDIFSVSRTDFIYSTPDFSGVVNEREAIMVVFEGYPITYNGEYYSNIHTNSAFSTKK